MTIDSGGGWLTPERKKAIVVSLYIWVPIAMISLIIWKYYSPHMITDYSPFLTNIDKIYVFWTFVGSVVLGFFVVLWIHLTGHKSPLWACVISFVWYVVLDGFGLFWEFLFLPSMVVPIMISYIYHRSGVVKFTWDGYFVSSLFSILAIETGIIVGYILAFAGIRGYAPY